MRKHFSEQLEDIKSDLLEMGELVTRNISNAVSILIEYDESLEKLVYDGELSVNALEKRIESKCLRIILFEQPVARDLRAITTALKIITDLERISDQSLDIAEITTRIIKHPIYTRPEHIISMAEDCREMVSQSIQSFVDQDLELANDVIKHDDDVDSLFLTVRDELIKLIRSNAEIGEQAIDFLMIAKYLERIADHAENVAEWVIFNISGFHKDERIL